MFLAIPSSVADVKRLDIASQIVGPAHDQRPIVTISSASAFGRESRLRNGQQSFHFSSPAVNRRDGAIVFCVSR